MPLTFRPLFRDSFRAAWDCADRSDAFAGTFIAKCDTLGRWDCCTGAFSDGSLVGATVLTFSKKTPTVANLQLMHTFSKHRGRGFGAAMLREVLERASRFARYFRVSSEPESAGFYRKQGLKFWGHQKSGCLLCMFRIDQDGTRSYDLRDPVVRDAVNKRGRGGVVSSFVDGAC